MRLVPDLSPVGWFLFGAMVLLILTYLYFWWMVIKASAHKHVSREKLTNRKLAAALAHAKRKGNTHRFLIQINSALANFARTGEGGYETLREEYLRLHNDESVTATTQELIDWLGTHLIRQQHPDARPMTYVESYPPRLDNILVPTGIDVGDWYLHVNVPGIYGTKDIQELTETLAELAVDKDAALRAYLSLPDTNAMSGDIMQDFHDCYLGVFTTTQEAIHDLAEVEERERDVFTYAEDRQLVIEQMNPDYEALREEVADAFDLVEEEGRVYVFHK